MAQGLSVRAPRPYHHAPVLPDGANDFAHPQVLDFAAPGYCAWGCFRSFLFAPWSGPVWQQLTERADDAVGLDDRAFGQAVAMHVDPDRIDAEALRRHDFPFQIVADHPGVFCS